MFKVNGRNTRTTRETSLKLTVNFILCSTVSVVNFEQVIADSVVLL